VAGNQANEADRANCIRDHGMSIGIGLTNEDGKL
jgi:hypothetical protein